ncbi:hypothetical protein T4D_10533, partial [Trichinella pseudospiralis]
LRSIFYSIGGAKICAQLLRGNSAWLNKTPS